ncbi:MAG: phosphotransferase [Minisyncoccia bacterium]|jgi:aminoglycoside phosphotransferase
MKDFHITFKLNKELDKEMALEFLGVKAGGIDFTQGIITVHPQLKSLLGKDAGTQKQIIDEYIDEFYKTHEELLNAYVVEMQKNWNKDETKFIEQLDIIFKNPEVPKGEYTGYLSILDCNPRFLDTKTFQVFYKHPSGSNYITAHEVLHFFFYDYAEKKYPQIFKKLDTNSGIFWDLAELFNVVVMSEPSFISEQYANHAKPYPAHAKYFDAAKNIWEKNRDIDSWLIEAYQFLSEQEQFIEWATQELGGTVSATKEAYGDQSSVFKLISLKGDYFLKIGGGLEKEKLHLEWLKGRQPVPDVIGFKNIGNTGALLLSSLEGANLKSVAHELGLEKVINILVEALHRFHNTNIKDCPFGTQGADKVLVHGDACLPNFIIKDGKFSGYIDLKDMRIDNKEVDLAAGVWSLQYNFGVGLGKTFLEKYGVKNPTEEMVEQLRLQYEKAIEDCGLN